MFKKLKQLTYDDLRFILEFGIPKRKGTLYDLRDGLLENMEPVFFLSTGRSGTKWFSELMQKDASQRILHRPQPDLAVQNKLIWEFYSSNDFKLETDSTFWIREIYLAARENYLRYSYKCDKRLIETNNAVTFFAPALAQLFPKAKFVHLIREPNAFLYSGMKRNYYAGVKDDMRRITSSEYLWKTYSRPEKVAWLWVQTNRFIRKFMQSENSLDVARFYFDTLQLSKVKQLMEFLGINVSDVHIQKSIARPVNMQPGANAPAMTEKEYKRAEDILQQELSNPYYDF